MFETLASLGERLADAAKTGIARRRASALIVYSSLLQLFYTLHWLASSCLAGDRWWYYFNDLLLLDGVAKCSSGPETKCIKK